MKTIKRAALGGAACVAIALPAAALAAHPVKGGHYSNQKDLSFATVSKTGRRAQLEVYSKCNNGIPVKANKAGKISSHGKLTYSGSATELATQNGTAHLSLSGKFVTRKTLKWTATVIAGSCKSTVKDTLTLMKSG